MDVVILNRATLTKTQWYCGIDSLELQISRLYEIQVANLQGANLSGANLQDADLINAKLEKVVWTEEDYFDEETYYTASLPDGYEWTKYTDTKRFTDMKHPEFWKSDS